MMRSSQPFVTAIWFKTCGLRSYFHPENDKASRGLQILLHHLAPLRPQWPIVILSTWLVLKLIFEGLLTAGLATWMEWWRAQLVQLCGSVEFLGIFSLKATDVPNSHETCSDQKLNGSEYQSAKISFCQPVLLFQTAFRMAIKDPASYLSKIAINGDHVLALYASKTVWTSNLHIFTKLRKAASRNMPFTRSDIVTRISCMNV